MLFFSSRVKPKNIETSSLKSDIAVEYLQSGWKQRVITLGGEGTERWCINMKCVKSCERGGGRETWICMNTSKRVQTVHFAEYWKRLQLWASRLIYYGGLRTKDRRGEICKGIYNLSCFCMIWKAARMHTLPTNAWFMQASPGEDFDYRSRYRSAPLKLFDVLKKIFQGLPP